MAFLLGDKSCMESLHTDVQDLHWAVMEVISRTGPLPFTSWKYPDQKSCEVNIEELLEMYNYSEDEEERQVANIILYELVIDRLMILLQSMATFTESLFASFKEKEDNSVSASCSLGLVAKRYWSRLTHLHTAIQQVQSENKSLKKKMKDMEKSMVDLKENKALAPNPPQAMSPGLLGLIPPNNADLVLMQGAKKYDISHDSSNKAAQTYETAFMPCESCKSVQDSLKQAGDMLIRTCDKHGLPSSLKKFKAQVSSLSWLTEHDVLRWSAEQNKDVTRISHYLERLASDVEPMKKQVEAFEKDLKNCETRTKKAETDLKQEKEITQTVKKQAEARLKEREAALGEDLAAALRERDSLVCTRRDLELELEKQRRQLSEQTEKLSDMEQTKSSLQRELDLSNARVEKLKGSEGEVATLHSQLSEVTERLDSTTKALTMEQARYRSATKHNESLQAKQVSLLERIDAMDREGEDLRDQVAELEEEKEQVATSLQAVQEEVKVLQLKVTVAEAEVEQLSKEKLELEKKTAETRQRVEELEKFLEEARERERLMIEYPDLNGPVNPDYQGTGDIVIDMENQVEANNVRIHILEEQNTGLRNSISKVLSLPGAHTSAPAPPQPGTLMTGGAQQLWNPATVNAMKTQNDSYSTDDHLQGNKSNNSSKSREAWSEKGKAHMAAPPPHPPKPPPSQTRVPSAKAREFLVGPSQRPDSASRAKERGSIRPPSGKTFQPVNNSSISAYRDLRKRGLLPTGTPSDQHHAKQTGVHIHGSSDNQEYATETFVCEQCDKMFTRARDLEIHHSYCTG